jgi:hypothetical protein
MEWSTDYGEKGSARNALRIAAITGVLAAPSAILLVDGLGTPYLGICALAGLLIVAKQGRLFLTDWRKAGVLLWFGILMLAYLLVTLANFALVDSSTFAFSRVQRQLLLLSIPVVFALLWWARPTLQVVASGIAVNAVVFGVYTMFSVLPGRERGVGLGVTHETLFGNAGLLLGFRFPCSDPSQTELALAHSWISGPRIRTCYLHPRSVPRRVVGHSAPGSRQLDRLH